MQCVGIGHPTIRFFSKRTSGGSLSTLRVEVLFDDALGETRSATIGLLPSGCSWSLSPQIPIVANLLPLLPDNTTPVAFRFTAQGGSFRIDDLYVDPYRNG
jgi:hypothetical protein